MLWPGLLREGAEADSHLPSVPVHGKPKHPGTSKATLRVSHHTCASLTLELRAQLPFLGGGTWVPVVPYVLCITLEPG